MKQASDRHEAASWGIQGASGDHQGHDEGLKGASQGQHGGITRAAWGHCKGIIRAAWGHQTGTTGALGVHQGGMSQLIVLASHMMPAVTVSSLCDASCDCYLPVRWQL